MKTAPSARHLYVHVPFCTRRCSYCDFAIAVRRVVPVDEYVRALRAEFAIRSLRSELAELDTVYLGGGTPSRLGPDGIASVLDIIRNAAPIAADAEITLEANPEDISVASVHAWRSAGINRLSIGVQSFDDRVLQWMHRVHDARAARVAIETARDAGLPAFSLDLIFAVPDTIHRDWREDLEKAIALQPDHISLYGLTFEEHTPLGKWRNAGTVAEAPEERYESEFMTAHQELVAAGFEHYEVSNFARPGKRARHNSAYWHGVPYVGVGPSAHGFDGCSRRWNRAAYAAWRVALEQGTDPIADSEVLTEQNRIAETVYLGLRTVDGLRLVSEDEASLVSRWRDEGWIIVSDSSDGSHAPVVRCTPSGWLRLDSLAAALTAIRSRS